MNKYNDAKYIEIIIEQLERDIRNLKILQSDNNLTANLIPACDCADLIDFIHIADPRKTQDDAYTEAIRRYFVKADKILLVPSWAYEFLSYLHRVIVENIEKYGYKGGLKMFFKKYPRAEKFKRAWDSGDYTRAQSYFQDDEPWVQILDMTDDETLQDLLGDTIKRFNTLHKSGKFVTLGDLIDIHDLGNVDQQIKYDVTLDYLKKLRPRFDAYKKNEMDARSLVAIASVSLISDDFPTAVTSAKDPLIAFYSAIDTAIEDEKFKNPNLISLARSPITNWVGELVNAAASDRVSDYLERGINFATNIKNDLQSRGDSLKKLYNEDLLPIDILNDEIIEIFNAKGKISSNLNPYNYFYRDVIFRPIERKGARRRKRDRQRPLEIDQAAEMLSTKNFENAMTEARKNVEEDAKEVVASLKPYVFANKASDFGELNLVELFAEIEKDFSRNIY